MWTMFQVLTVVGLFFEFASVFLTVKKLFYDYHKRLTERGQTFQQQIKREKIEGTLVLIFLIIGMTLQGIAVFV